MEKVCTREEAESSPLKNVQGLLHADTSCASEELPLLLCSHPPPSPLLQSLPCGPREAWVCVLSLIGDLQHGESVRSFSSTWGMGQLSPQTRKEAAATRPTALPLRRHPQEQQGGDPPPFYSCKGSRDTTSWGSLNGTCVHFDEGSLGWLLQGGWAEAEFMEEGCSPKMLGDGKPDTAPQAPGLMRGPSRSRIWPLKATPASNLPESLSPQHS